MKNLKNGMGLGNSKMIRIEDIYRDDFINTVRGKRIICFGAGKELEYFFSDKKELIPNIECVVDNLKKDPYMQLDGKDIRIVSFEKLDLDDDEYMFLLTTIKHALDFISQMERCSYFEDKIVYVSYLINRSRKKKSDNFVITQKTPRIPKKIHYCWFGRAEIPKSFQCNIESWKRYNPEYEIIQWNEDNYDISKNKYMKQAYENKKWGFVPDYARLDIVNTYGGIYLDTDVEVLKSFDDLLGYEFFCGFEDEEYIALGLGFGAEKNNPILKKMLEQYEQLSFINSDGSLNLVASPVYQSEVMKEYGVVMDGKSREYNNTLVLSHEYFAPLDHLGFGELTQKAFSIHQYAASWLGDEEMLEKKTIYNNMEVIEKRIIK